VLSWLVERILSRNMAQLSKRGDYRPAKLAGMRREREHWEQIYADREPDQVSWFEPVPSSSLAMIEGLGLPLDAPILDVGGGASRLAEELVRRGYADVTVADISGQALERAREGFQDADRVEWVLADVRDHDFGRRFALWHDRALFQFMVSPEDCAAYLATLERSLRLSGHVVMATFGPEGPTRCSGLSVARYGADALAATIAERASLASFHLEQHRTPSGASQQFLYAHLTAPAARA
jgi:SAM-dependent methyltransferase